MTVVEFQAFINENELEVPLQKFLQSQIDKQVEKILFSKAEDLRTLASRETQITNELTGAGLNNSFAKYVVGNTSQEIKDSVQKINEDFLNTQQGKINQTLEQIKPPISNPQSGGNTELESYIEKKNTQSSKKPTIGFPQPQE